MPLNDSNSDNAQEENVTTLADVFAKWELEGNEFNQNEANRLASEIIAFITQAPGRTSFINSFNANSDFRKVANDFVATECDALSFLEYIQTEAGKNKFVDIVRKFIESSESEEIHPLLSHFGSIDNIEKHVNFNIVTMGYQTGAWELDKEEVLDPATGAQTSTMVLKPI